MNSKTKVEFGDFQTSKGLAMQICASLARRGILPDVILEPTCGIGAFLLAAAEVFPNARLFGWDINGDYVEKARAAIDQAGAGGRAVIATRDFFKHNWESENANFSGNVLILGNPPWVTNAVVAGLNGTNVPEKENFQGFRGIEARTGKSNFDISEWMLIQLLKALRGTSATIALLCKTAIARKVLRFAWLNDCRITKASLHRIDAKKHFGASVEACLLLAQTGSAGATEAELFDDIDVRLPSKTLGLAGQDLVSNIGLYREIKHLEGLCPYQWRSGVKHDCSSVMELYHDEAKVLRNKLGENVEVEPDFVFPLLKCSDLANGRTEPERFVLVTQKKVGEDTSPILNEAPRTWSYLYSHKERFDARKSSIYAKRIPFALFGIGDYSFAPWKVAVSGLHKTPRFVCVAPYEGKPVFFDDACYFLSFHNPEEARIVAAILNSAPCLRFISSLLFDDSKRPVTVELLERLNLHAIAHEAKLAGEWAFVRNQQYSHKGATGAAQTEFLMDSPQSLP
jgi:hypothetical protein